MVVMVIASGGNPAINRGAKYGREPERRVVVTY
jgi:hypothetical protein